MMATKMCFWERCSDCLAQGCHWIFHQSSPAACFFDSALDPDGITGIIEPGGFCFEETTGKPNDETSELSPASLTGIIGGAICGALLVGGLTVWGFQRIIRTWRLRRFNRHQFWDAEPPMEMEVRVLPPEDPVENLLANDDPPVEHPPHNQLEHGVEEAVGGAPVRTIADRIRENEQRRAREHEEWMNRVQWYAQNTQEDREEPRPRDSEAQRLIRQLLPCPHFRDLLAGRLPHRRARQ